MAYNITMEEELEEQLNNLKCKYKRIHNTI